MVSKSRTKNSMKTNKSSQKSKSSTKRQKGGDGFDDEVKTCNNLKIHDKDENRSPLEQINDVLYKLPAKAVPMTVEEYEQYKFWEDCHIGENYMGSGYNVLVMTPDVLLFRGMKAPCDTIYDPHSVKDVFQQKPSWYSDYNTANVYAENMIWCYTPIRPLVLFELTNYNDVKKLYDFLYDKCKSAKEFVTSCDEYIKIYNKLVYIANIINVNTSTKAIVLVHELLSCLEKFPKSTDFHQTYVDYAITECENIIIDQKFDDNFNTNETNMDYLNSLLPPLRTASVEMAKKYIKSLEIISGTTGVSCSIEEQFKYLGNGDEDLIAKNKEIYEDWKVSTDTDVLNRVSYHDTDFKLVEILRENLPWCDGYYGRETRSTAHNIFHREVCIFGSHGKLKLMRSIKLCTPKENLSVGGSVPKTKSKKTKLKGGDDNVVSYTRDQYMSPNNGVFIKNLNANNNKNVSNTKPNTMSKNTRDQQANTNITNMPQNIQVVERKVAPKPPVRNQVHQSSMSYNDAVGLEYDRVIMDFHKSYLCPQSDKKNSSSNVKNIRK